MINKVIIHFAALSAETGEPIVTGTKIKIALPGVIHKYTVVNIMVHAYIKRYGRVYGILPGCICIGIAVPVGVGIAFTVQRACFFAKANKMFTILHFFVS